MENAINSSRANFPIVASLTNQHASFILSTPIRSTDSGRAVNPSAPPTTNPSNSLSSIPGRRPPSSVHGFVISSGRSRIWLRFYQSTTPATSGDASVVIHHTSSGARSRGDLLRKSRVRGASFLNRVGQIPRSFPNDCNRFSTPRYTVQI